MTPAMARAGVIFGFSGSPSMLSLDPSSPPGASPEADGLGRGLPSVGSRLGAEVDGLPDSEVGVVEIDASEGDEDGADVDEVVSEEEVVDMRTDVVVGDGIGFVFGGGVGDGAGEAACRSSRVLWSAWTTSGVRKASTSPARRIETLRIVTYVEAPQ
jgi:hypothetical protein